MHCLSKRKGSLTIFVLQVFEAKTFQSFSFYSKKVNILENNFGNKDAEPDKNINALIPKISFVYSFAATVWKSYILIFLTLDVCWFSKLYLFPVPAANWGEFLNRPAFGFAPGWFFFAFAGCFWLIYFSLGFWYFKKSRKEDNQ